MTFTQSEFYKLYKSRNRENKAKGALMSVIANIPNFILSGVCVITMGITYFNGQEMISGVSALFNLLVRFFMAMYLGILQGLFSSFSDNTILYYFTQSIGYFLIPVFAILASHFGYTLGLKEKKLFGATANSKKK